MHLTEIPVFLWKYLFADLNSCGLRSRHLTKHTLKHNYYSLAISESVCYSLSSSATLCQSSPRAKCAHLSAALAFTPSALAFVKVSQKETLPGCLILMGLVFMGAMQLAMERELLDSYSPWGTAQITDGYTPSIFLWRRPICLPKSFSLRSRLLFWYLTRGLWRCSQRMENGECHVCAESLPCTRSPMCPRWSCYTHLTPLVLWLHPGVPLSHLTLKATGVCTGKFHGTGTAVEPVPVIYACPSPSTRKLQTLKSNPILPEQDLLAYHHSSGQRRGGCLIKHTS